MFAHVEFNVDGNLYPRGYFVFRGKLRCSDVGTDTSAKLLARYQLYPDGREWLDRIADRLTFHREVA